ncbi:MAG: DUF2023 family protein [Pyramidobacter sp.]
MEVFRHHVYEYKKGLRNLILHTAPQRDLPEICRILKAEKIPCRVVRLENGYANVFFGSEDCIRVLEIIGSKGLDRFTKEEDFILGIMLGYGRLVECRRFIELSERDGSHGAAAAD